MKENCIEPVAEADKMWPFTQYVLQEAVQVPDRNDRMCVVFGAMPFRLQALLSF